MTGPSRATAYHEAGHVVASLMTGHIVHQVQIGPYRGTLVNRHGQPVVCAGLMEGLPLAHPSHVQSVLASLPAAKKDYKHRAVDNAFISGAGPAAEARFSRRGWQGIVLGLSWRSDGDFADAMTALEPFQSDEDRRSNLVDRIWESSRRFISRPAVWDAVSALAEELMVHGKMDFDQIKEALEPLVIKHVAYGNRVLTPRQSSI